MRKILAAGVLVVIALFLPLSALAKNPEDARKELDRLNIPFETEEFVKRAMEGDTAAARLFLAAGMSPDTLDKDGRAILMVAAAIGHREIVEILLDEGAKPNVKAEGLTALGLTAFFGHTEIVQLLLDNGAHVNGCSDNSSPSDSLCKEVMIPLSAAIMGGQQDVAKLLLEIAAEVTESPNLTESSNHNETVNLLLEKGAKVNAKDEDGVTALMIAAESGQLEIVQILLDHQADVNDISSIRQGTALAAAAEEGHIEVARILLGKGADLNAKRKDGWTPLRYATVAGHADIAELLKEAGAEGNYTISVEQTEWENRFTREQARTKEREKILREMAEQGANDEELALALQIMERRDAAKSQPTTLPISVRSHKLEIVADDKVSDDEMIVDLLIFQHEGTLYAEWTHIFVDPWEDQEVVVLKVEQYSSAEGTISDIQVHDNSFSLVLDVSTLFFPGRKYQVVGKKKDFDFEIHASALWWSEVLQREMKMEWRSTGETFVELPYNKLY